MLVFSCLQQWRLDCAPAGSCLVHTYVWRCRYREVDRFNAVPRARVNLHVALRPRYVIGSSCMQHHATLAWWPVRVQRTCICAPQGAMENASRSGSNGTGKLSTHSEKHPECLNTTDNRGSDDGKTLLTLALCKDTRCAPMG